RSQEVQLAVAREIELDVFEPELVDAPRKRAIPVSECRIQILVLRSGLLDLGKPLTLKGVGDLSRAARGQEQDEHECCRRRPSCARHRRAPSDGTTRNLVVPSRSASPGATMVGPNTWCSLTNVPFIESR